MINLTAHALLFTIAAIGISETAYLIRKRQEEEKPVCPIFGGGCETVLNSKYNRLFFGMHNEYGGIIFYIVLAVIAALLVIGIDSASFLVLIAEILLVLATLATLALIYIQWKIIKAWCFWCLMSAATVGLMDIILLTSKLT